MNLQELDSEIFPIKISSMENKYFPYLSDQMPSKIGSNSRFKQRMKFKKHCKHYLSKRKF
jgi:hypothetical protein